MKKLNCSILTPERYLFEGNVDLAVVTASDGEMGFLVDHAPLIAELGAGEVRLSEDKKTELFAVEGGIVEIKDNKVTILAERAFKKVELVPEEIEKNIKELQTRTFEKYSDERIVVQTEISNLRSRLKIARK